MTDSTHHHQFEQVVRRLDPQGKLVRTWELTGGISAQMTALEMRLPDGQTRKMIVRRPGEATLKANPQAASEQFRFLQIVQSAGLDAPQPYDLDTSGEIFPTPYLVIEYIEGEPDYAPSDRGAYIRQAAAMLARIHQADISAHEVSFLLTQMPVRERLAEAAPLPDMTRIRAALEAAGHLTPLNQIALLHGDFWPGNWLWQAGRLVAVVDWEDVKLGDPLADLGISRMDMTLLFGKEAMHEFTRQYEAMNPLDYTHLPYWDLYAVVRAAPHLAEWSAMYPSVGRPDISEQTMRKAHGWFTAQAWERWVRGKFPC